MTTRYDDQRGIAQSEHDSERREQEVHGLVQLVLKSEAGWSGDTGSLYLDADDIASDFRSDVHPLFSAEELAPDVLATLGRTEQGATECERVTVQRAGERYLYRVDGRHVASCASWFEADDFDAEQLLPPKCARCGGDLTDPGEIAHGGCLDCLGGDA